MVESDFDHAAAATRLATLVDTTSKELTTKLPAGAVRPLYSTTEAGAVVDRNGRELRPPVKRKTPGAA